MRFDWLLVRAVVVMLAGSVLAAFIYLVFPLVPTMASGMPSALNVQQDSIREVLALVFVVSLSAALMCAFIGWCLAMIEVLTSRKRLPLKILWLALLVFPGAAILPVYVLSGRRDLSDEDELPFEHHARHTARHEAHPGARLERHETGNREQETHGAPETKQKSPAAKPGARAPAVKKWKRR